MRPEDLATCISCGLCLNDCPTYRVLGAEADSPRGRVQLIRELVASPGAPEPQLAGHLDSCLVCRACETACPSGVPFGRIMEGAREVLRERRHDGRLAGAASTLGLGTVAARRRLAMATRVADLYVGLGLRRLLRSVLPRRLAWVSSFAARSEGPAFKPIERTDADLCFFAGCVMREAFGDTQRATVRVLEREGRRATAPAEQVCCGALHAHAGDGATARALARRNVVAFEGSDALVVVNAAGCGAHLKAYGHVLGAESEWAERARRFASRVRDASEVARPSARVAVRPLRIVYQDACHLSHGQRVRSQPRALLKAIPGATLVEITDADRCCGSAGIYNLTQPRISAELQRQKVAAILAADPDVVVSANPGCILQIAAGLREVGAHVPILHLMRFLDDPAAAPSTSRKPH